MTCAFVFGSPGIIIPSKENGINSSLLLGVVVFAPRLIALIKLIFHLANGQS